MEFTLQYNYKFPRPIWCLIYLWYIVRRFPPPSSVSANLVSSLLVATVLASISLWPFSLWAALADTTRNQLQPISSDIIWYHPKSSDISQYHLISANTIRYQPISSDTIRYHLISSDISQYHLISANISQYHPIQSGMSCANIIANFLSSFGFTLSLWDCSSIVFTLPPYCTFITSWHFLQQIRILSNCHHHQNIWGHLTLRCTSDFLFITDMLWKLDWNPRCTAPGFWLQFVTQGQVYMKRIFSGISTKTLKDRPPPDFDWQ